MRSVEIGQRVRINHTGMTALLEMQLGMPDSLEGTVMGLDVIEREFAVDVDFGGGVQFTMLLAEVDLVPEHKWVGEYKDTGSERSLHFSGGADDDLTFSIREGGDTVSEHSFVCLHPNSLLWLHRDVKAVLKTYGLLEEGENA